MGESAEHSMERIFDAPREMVWRAWTEPEHLARWYGPNIETIIHKFELKPGGIWLNEMRWGGNSDFARIEFTEVVAPEKLVWHQSSADADWNVISNPMMPDWPRTIITAVDFADQGPQTKILFRWIPYEASEAELAAFAAASDKLGQGWASGFAIIDEILAELQN